MGEKRVIEQVASNEVYNDDWFLKDSPTQDTSKISATNLKAILGADGTQALEEIANAIAEEYDSTHTYYNTGLVFHEGVLYQCTATSTTGTWDSTKWNVVDIKDLLDNVSINIGYLWNIISNTIAGNYDTSSTYNTGDYAIYSLKLYRCKDDGVTGAWNSSKWEEVNIPEYIDYVLENAGIVKDVEVDGTSVVNASGVAEITLPDVPVQDVQVKTDSTYDSVVDASGNAKIDLSSVTAYGEVPNLPQAIASFKDGADAPMPSLKVAIEPQQEGSGDPSPENIRPISGWSAVDVTDIDDITNKSFFDGLLNGTYGVVDLGSLEWSYNSSRALFVALLSDGKATGTNTGNGGGITAKYTTVIKTYGDMVSGEMSIGSNYSSSSTCALLIKDSAYTDAQTFKTAMNGVHLIYELATPTTPTVTSSELNALYAEFGINGSTITIQLGDTYYGGEVDVVNGEGTDRLGSVDMGTLAWSSTTNNRFVADLNDVISISGDFVDFMCEMFTPRASIENGSIWINNKKIYVVDTTHSTTTDFTNFVNGKKIVYPLATPTTYNTQPTAIKSLRGVNNVYANTGDVNDCVYRRDMSSTIDDIIARLEALEG